MKQQQIDRRLVLATLSKMGPVFRTRELSAHPDMVAGHACASDPKSNYHSMIGAYLSRNVTEVELIERLQAPMGARWKNLRHGGGGVVDPPAAAPKKQPVAVDQDGLGPQYPADDEFTARMRLHQSWYRAHVLGVRCGTGPTKGATNSYGNMLAAADAEAGKNFLSPEIFATVERRLAERVGAVEPFRLMHNMLSSQPMCFNLFGPLIDDLELATSLVRALMGEHVARVTRVAIEWAPSPKHEYLDDNTAFDAFIEYERTDGALGFVGIETKLTEPFSNKHADKPTYRRWMTSDSPWRSDASQEVDRIAHNQLWRDHLLAWALLRHPQSPYREGSLAVVYHAQDRRCATVLGGYRALLRDEATLRAFTLDSILAVWRPIAGPGSWLDDFAARYVELERSDSVGPEQGSRAPATRPGKAAVRDGHLRMLQALELDDAYPRTLELYRAALGGVDVYLRPTDAGFTVLSLDVQRCVSMIGVGGPGTGDHSIRSLPPDSASIRTAVAGYLAKRDALARYSAEETYALELVSAALAGGMALPDSEVHMLAQEWRLPSGGRPDLIAVDARTGVLVVVELKDSEASARKPDASKGGDAWDQARRYAAELQEHRAELYPFFQRLGRAMARHHQGPPAMQSLELDADVAPEILVAWPGGGFRRERTGLGAGAS